MSPVRNQSHSGPEIVKTAVSNGVKTIFVSVSSLAAFKNLFFFPGCFFDLACGMVKTRKDFRFVFVLPKERMYKFEYVFSGRQNDQISVEGISVDDKLTLPGKIFRFFYSYLIYTSTTKLLATMGTRPDEMPPGSRHLWPLKVIIANIFGRSRFVKTQVTPLLFNAFFSKNHFSHLFEKYRPDTVFLPHMLGWFDNLLLREAKNRGIKTFGMAANWDHVDKYFIPLSADNFIAQNELIKQAAIREQGYREDQVSVVGYPHFDFIWKKEYLTGRRALLREMGFPENAKYLLYISGSVYCPDEPDVIEEVLKWIDEGRFGPDTRMVIRPYLGGRFRDRDFDEKKFTRFAENPKVFMYSRESWKDLKETEFLLNIMAHASVVMSAFSTAALEVSLFDRPLIGIGFDGHKIRPLHRSVKRFEGFTHFQDIFKTGAVRVVRNFGDLYSALDAYLKNPALDSEKRELMRNTMCYKLDGRASERILENVIQQ